MDAADVIDTIFEAINKREAILLKYLRKDLCRVVEAGQFITRDEYGSGLEHPRMRVCMREMPCERHGPAPEDD